MTNENKMDYEIKSCQVEKGLNNAIPRLEKLKLKEK